MKSPFSLNRDARRAGSTLFIAVMTIALCSIVIATYLQTLMPKFRSAHQAMAWRESLQAAEAGVNHALTELNTMAAANSDSSNYPWAAKGWSLIDALFSLNGERILDAALLPVLGSSSNSSVANLSIDVYTRQPTAPYHPWFRIRSTGQSALPDRLLSGDRRDGRLRRMKLSAKEAGKSSPFVKRTVEAIVKPRHRFSRAITTVADLSLGNSSNWTVDSFDSSNPDKSDAGTSAGGIYPADPTKRLENGNIASARTLPAESPYGELIDGNGARVHGQVQTSGGDNPGTVERENVTGNFNMDQSRIRDDFDDYIPPPPTPSWPVSLPPPIANGSFLAGTESVPLRYTVFGNLGSFQVLPAPPGTTGYIEILVKGNLNIGSGNSAEIIIPPNVKAMVYVQGNVDFGNGMVNTGTGSSKVASHLTVFGLSTSPSASYRASGNTEQALTFYGPNYDVDLNGTVKSTGAMVSKSFRISGGGNGGFHYDEVLGLSGDIMGWVLVSYFEDTRGE